MKSDRFAVGAALQVLFTFASAYVHAQNVVRIEEEWALQVREPDLQLNSPQITTAMLPFGGSSSVIAYLDINHSSAPDYSPGGFQVRLESPSNSSSKRILGGTSLNRNSETIKWTQVLVKYQDQVSFGIVSGSSQTWGYFGGIESFTSCNVGNGNSSLDNYSPTDSLQNSGVIFGGNRVASLTLLRVRIYNSLGQMVEVTINQSPL